MVDRYGIPGASAVRRTATKSSRGNQRKQKERSDVSADSPRTHLFDGELAQRGYALNKMCFSLNEAENRAAFLADEPAYLDRFGLTPAQRDAVERRDVLAMLAAGGNVYYLAKMAGAWGLGVQDLGALQTGVSVEEFKQQLLDAGRCVLEHGEVVG